MKYERERKAFDRSLLNIESNPLAGVKVQTLSTSLTPLTAILALSRSSWPNSSAQFDVIKSTLGAVPATRDMLIR
jgi:hypothetical protein